MLRSRVFCGAASQKHCAANPTTCTCYMLRLFAHPVASYCMLLGVVVQSLKPVKHQKFSTFLFFRDHRSIVQQCWIHLHSSSNIVGVTHVHNTRFTKSYGLYPSHNALQVPTLLAVVSFFCTPLPTHRCDRLHIA